MKKGWIVIVCLSVLIGRALSFSSYASVTTHAQANTSQPKKQTKEAEAPNLVNDPTFSKFDQKEENSWVYAMNNTKNTSFAQVPLTPSEQGGYDVPDGEGGSVIGHLEQTDLEGIKGLRITTNAASKATSVHAGQLMTGLQVGQYYTFSIGVKASEDLSANVALRSKKLLGKVSPDTKSVNYLSSSALTVKLAANQWKTLSYTFQAKEATAYFDLNYTTSGNEVNFKQPKLQADLPDGFLPGTAGDEISWKEGKDEIAMNWTDHGVPALDYNGRNYLFNRNRLDGSPIVNKKASFRIVTGPSFGGLFFNIGMANRAWGINENTLYQAFTFTDPLGNDFRIEIFKKDSLTILL